MRRIKIRQVVAYSIHLFYRISFSDNRKLRSPASQLLYDSSMRKNPCHIEEVSPPEVENAVVFDYMSKIRKEETISEHSI